MSRHPLVASVLIPITPARTPVSGTCFRNNHQANIVTLKDGIKLRVKQRICRINFYAVLTDFPLFNENGTKVGRNG